MGWSRLGRPISVVAHNDREATKILEKLPKGPSMQIRRALAEPCTFLMAKDDERVTQLRKSWAPGWAR